MQASADSQSYVDFILFSFRHLEIWSFSLGSTNVEKQWEKETHTRHNLAKISRGRLSSWNLSRSKLSRGEKGWKKKLYIYIGEPRELAIKSENSFNWGGRKKRRERKKQSRRKVFVLPDRWSSQHKLILAYMSLENAMKWNFCFLVVVSLLILFHFYSTAPLLPFFYRLTFLTLVCSSCLPSSYYNISNVKCE